MVPPTETLNLSITAISGILGLVQFLPPLLDIEVSKS